jgi:hypothetical protein
MPFSQIRITEELRNCLLGDSFIPGINQNMEPKFFFLQNPKKYSFYIEPASKSFLARKTFFFFLSAESQLDSVSVENPSITICEINLR